jgi:hypothetical protein
MTGSDATFELERQSAETISNVGGNQNVYYDGKRTRAAVVVGRAVALAVFFAGLGLLIVTIVHTTNAVLGDADRNTNWANDISNTWMPAVVLLGAGIVLTRFGRLFAGR